MDEKDPRFGDLRPTVQDILSKRAPCFLDEGNHVVTTGLSATEQHLPLPPVNIAQLESAYLAVSHSRGGYEQQQGAIALSYGVRSIDRFHKPVHIFPWEIVWNPCHPPDRYPRHITRKILLADGGPLQISKHAP